MKNFRAASTTLASLLALTAAVTLSGCAPAAETSEKFQIVASTNVWGDVAKQVGGDLVEVTSIIDSESQDPHSYEASARDQLAIQKADLIISNGGGYDDFIDVLAQAVGNKPEVRVNTSVTTVAWQENEHLWYSVPAVAEFTFALAEAISSLDPANETAYAANAKNYVDQLAELGKEIGALRAITNGYTYFGTEPLAVWLMSDLGFEDKTPNEFSEAIENETDVPPAVMKKSLDLIASGEVKYLVVNSQTENSQTNQILTAAKAAGVKAVVLGEILPAGLSYIDWMRANLKTLNPGK